MAFNQSFFLIIVLLASGVVLGKVESGEATETTNAVKTASRKMLPIGGQITKMLGVGGHDGQEGSCIAAGEPCAHDPWGCCPGCYCVWQLTDFCAGTC